MSRYPAKPAADHVASKGRYGDSTLIHVNPLELQGLASLAPGGKLPVNPETGYPEAWLFLAPMLGSWLGSAALGGSIATGLAGTGMAAATAATMGSAIAGGIGSGIATAAVTGDLERGAVAGIMGAGLGAATGAAGSAMANDQAAQLATSAATAGTPEAIAQKALDATVLGPQAGSGAAVQVPMRGWSPPMQPSVAALPRAATVGAVTNPAQAYKDLGFMGRLKAPVQKPGAFMGQLTDPKSALPLAIGGSQLAELEANAEMEEFDAQQGANREAERREAYDNLQRAYRAAQPGAMIGLNPYRNMMSRNTPLPMYYAAGGRVEPRDPLAGSSGGNKGYQGIDPVTVQQNLRGQYAVAPPPGFMPGFSPEFDYFQNDPNNIVSPPVTGPADWNQIYANSPISNRFDPNGGPYFQSVIPPAEGAPLPTGRRSKYPTTIPKQPRSGLASLSPKGVLDTVFSAEQANLGINSVAAMRQRSVGGGMGGSGARRRRLMAEGGEVMLEGAAGQAQVAPGGIANVPTQFSQPQQQAQQQPTEQDIYAVAMALTGQAGEQADSIIEAFISQYGTEVFRMIREMILKTAGAPNAQTEGMVRGPGGGMDDQVTGTIGGQQPVAVSPGEYIVPADVVSGLGDGSSDAGAQELDRMAQNVRMARGGTTTQPPPFDAQRVMPA